MSPASPRMGRPMGAIAPAGATTAQVLKALNPPFTVWHQVPVPGTRASIDHVVLGPAGLFVIEVRTYRWPVRSRKGQLRSGDLPLQGALEMVSWKAERLRAELASAESPSRRPQPVLCIQGAALPRRVVETHGVRILDPAGLAQLLQRHEVLDSTEIRQIEDRLQLMLPPKS